MTRPHADETRATPARAAASEDQVRRWTRAALRDLPLRVIARLAQGRASLGTIRELRPGKIVPLDSQVGDEVLLLAEDQPVARGELLENEGKLSFRVSRIGEKDE